MSTAAATLPPPRRRRWLATEVVQTSAMDCGPATLKCVLEGFGIRASYGRLREACQTSVDGTSIDTLEAVAPDLGVAAEQVLIPVDHVFLPAAAALPAIVVVRLADGATHFVVLWRQVGGWLQVMDPAVGRRWVHCRRFAEELHRHQHRVPEADWRAWAQSEEFAAPLRQRLRALGTDAATAQALLAQAWADPGWFGCGTLDASVRLVQSMVSAGGLETGPAAARLVQALCEQCRARPDDIFGVVPAAYWSATPDPESAALGALHLRLQGAVLLRLRAGAPRAPQAEALAPELAAALSERPAHPLAHGARLLRQEGLLGPLALCGAMVVAGGAIVAETLLFRGLFGLASQLGAGPQRVAALLALVLFAALLLAFEWPIVRESLRHGRHLEARLRMALLAKLPRLHDRYFQSRSVSDMAERGHMLQLARQVPGLGLNFVQAGSELLFTLAGVALIAPASLPWALAIVLFALALPLAMQPVLAERDLRARNHASALNAFYLDALLGLVPVRTHGAQGAVRLQQEALLVQWARAARRLAAAGLASSALQQLVGTGLVAGLLVAHFTRAGEVGGADLLLVYWALKLGALGGNLAALGQQVPAQRNVLLRLLEPLNAPEVQPAAATRPAPKAISSGPAALQIDHGRVVASGHTLLQDLNLRIAAGEHVAIVGASGAGKSSLLGLLLGWHRLAEGRLAVDGAEPDAAAQDALRRHTAWVDPAVQLFNRSLLDNLAYAGPDDTPTRVGEVLAAARLRGVLARLPEGLQTALGEGGALLSGGEGQRVRLARALLQTKVRLVLLDEPFRGLDREQRSQLLAQSRAWWQAATLLCVTHDVGETLHFPRVLVVDRGRIVEDGAPQALAAQAHSRYAALLRAEAQVRRHSWQGAHWRQVRVEAGRVVTPSGTASNMPH